MKSKCFGNKIEFTSPAKPNMDEQTTIKHVSSIRPFKLNFVRMKQQFLSHQFFIPIDHLYLFQIISINGYLRRSIYFFFILFLSACTHTNLTPPDYPPLLKGPDGQKIHNSRLWEKIQRPYILSQFEQEVYGKNPSGGLSHEFLLCTSDSIIIENIHAIRKQIKMIFYNSFKTDSQLVDLLLYLPVNQQEPVPVFIGLNFYGNHTITTDTGVFITSSWVRDNENFMIFGNKADDRSRGVRISRWPTDLILSNGYGLATMYYGDIDPDFDDNFKNGIHRLSDTYEDSVRKGENWGSIAAWAYGLSSALNYLENLSEVDPEKIIVLGHSRLGKTALWAGAIDQRFAIVISNNSGCGGAALSRRRAGETVEIINTHFPHWFCDNFNKYNENEEMLPVDQHMLIALIAPRPVYIASAEKDQWADPEGEFLAACYAGDVYSLYNKKILPSSMPPLDSPLTEGHIGYHIRSGVHDLTRYDWEQYIKFANRHFGRDH